MNDKADQFKFLYKTRKNKHFEKKKKQTKTKI